VNQHPFHESRWSSLTDYALLVGSGAGAIASFATQNAAIASLPVTALVAMGLLNRRRIDRLLAYADEQMGDLESRVGQDLASVKEQVTALPTPEALLQLQRSTIEHSDRALVQFSEALADTRQDFQQRLAAVESPDLSHIYQETAQLQDQYTYVCTTLSNQSKQIERLSHLPRMEAAEAEVAQIKTDLMQLRVSLDSLSSESKTAQSTLQDAVRHLDRRLRQVPNSADPNMLKSEIRELMKAMADLIPRREFMVLSEKLHTLQESQETLRQTLNRLRSSKDGALHGVGHSEDAELKALKSEILKLTSGLKQIETRLEDMAIPFDITAEIRGTTATYLSGLQWQLSLLEQQTQDLAQRQADITLPSPNRLLGGTATLHDTGNNANGAQWLLAFRGEALRETWSAIDQAIFEALDTVSERLVLVWPWSDSVALEQRLLERFTEVLGRGCRLEIGWCHPGDRTQGRFLKPIARQWQLTTAHRQRLKTTLSHLLPLKQQYPDHFSFKILGTDEQFLVCDRTYAIVGLHALPASSSTFPELDVRVKTPEIGIVNRLLHRFDHASALPEDDTAFFNRAITRYDLHDPDGAIADFTHVLRLKPTDAVTLNNRAILWAEKKNYPRTFEDLNRALEADAEQFAARCNRGWLLLHQGQINRAIADFDQAIQSNPKSALPYFYRGIARQRLTDSKGAIADFTQAIKATPQVALPYCYRGTAYHRLGDIPRAISDLETAASLFHAQGEHRSLAQVTQTLSTLKQAELNQPVKLHSA
jgi:tetratricopeptide (TPR) repeat protein